MIGFMISLVALSGIPSFFARDHTPLIISERDSCSFLADSHHIEKEDVSIFGADFADIYSGIGEIPVFTLRGLFIHSKDEGFSHMISAYHISHERAKFEREILYTGKPPEFTKNPYSLRVSVSHSQHRYHPLMRASLHSW
jgi:hypothetical protein